MRDVYAAMKTQTYTLPAYWELYLLQGDDSGLRKNEIKAVDRWLEEHPNLLAVSRGSDEVWQHNHDGGNYGAMVCKFAFQTQKEPIQCTFVGCKKDALFQITSKIDQKITFTCHKHTPDYILKGEPSFFAKRNGGKELNDVTKL